MGTGGGQRPEPGRAQGATKEQGRRRQRQQRDGGLCWRLVQLNCAPSSFKHQTFPQHSSTRGLSGHLAALEGR